MKQKIVAVCAALLFVCHTRSAILTFRGFGTISISFVPAPQVVQQVQQVVRPLISQPVLQAVVQPALQAVIPAPIFLQSWSQASKYVFNKYGPAALSFGVLTYMGYLAWQQRGTTANGMVYYESAQCHDKMTEPDMTSMVKENDRNARLLSGRTRD